jgi:hypothetical protein
MRVAAADRVALGPGSRCARPGHEIRVSPSYRRRRRGRSSSEVRSPARRLLRMLLGARDQRHALLSCPGRVERGVAERNETRDPAGKARSAIRFPECLWLRPVVSLWVPGLAAFARDTRSRTTHGSGLPRTSAARSIFTSTPIPVSAPTCVCSRGRSRLNMASRRVRSRAVQPFHRIAESPSRERRRVAL